MLHQRRRPWRERRGGRPRATSQESKERSVLDFTLYECPRSTSKVDFTKKTRRWQNEHYPYPSPSNLSHNFVSTRFRFILYGKSAGQNASITRSPVRRRQQRPREKGRQQSSWLSSSSNESMTCGCVRARL